ncbi:MAG: T9SS type A sorting domain-containing protein [bacterium]
MRLLKLFLTVLFLFLSLQHVFSQSFTYSGPTDGTSPFNYTFQYYNLAGLYYPTLVIGVDGDVVAYDLCSAVPLGGWCPSSYSISLTPGNHTISLKLLSVNSRYLDCHYFLVHQEVNINVTVKAVISADNNFTSSGSSHGSVKIDGTTYTAPKTFSKHIGAGTTLEAITPQNNSAGKQMIWNTSSCQRSKWTKGGALKSYDQSYTFTATIADHNTTYLANYFLNSITTAGTMSISEAWISSVTLSDNVYVPSGVTLDITSCSSVNLNGKSIISTGGTITCSGSISGLKAYLKSGSTVKGYCGSIQTACTNGSSGYTVDIQSGTFTENVSFSGKTNLTIQGQGISSTTVNGIFTASSCSGLIFQKMECKTISLSNCTSINIMNNMMDGTTNGLYAYNTSFSGILGTIENAGGTGFAPASSTGTVSSGGAPNSVYTGGKINLCGGGVMAAYGSNISLYTDNVNNRVELCNDVNWDLYVSNSGTITATGCKYTDGIPVTINAGGTLTVNTPYYSCPSPKRGTISEGNYNNIINSGSDPAEEEFIVVNSAYLELMNTISEAVLSDAAVNVSDYYDDYMNSISLFSEFIEKNPESGLAKTALTTAVHCYKILGDYEGMNTFLNNTIADKNLIAVNSLAKRFTMDYYSNKKDFEKSLSIADELLKESADDKDFTYDVLYAKGLIYEYDLYDAKNAVECFMRVVNEAPENILADGANNELSLLGIEVDQNKKGTDGNKVEGFGINNYPNPFNPTTTIKYTIPEDGIVTIKVFDVLGREIKTLVNQRQLKGNYSVEFDASGLASGMYIYQIRMNNYVQSKKMVLLR